MRTEQKNDTRWTILMADDEPTQRLIMARLLKRAGYNVHTAANGFEILKAVEEHDIHLMITDTEMPETDDAALFREMRSRSRSYIYTIILSPRDSIEHLVAGLQSGADDYLTKPVIEAELIARLSTGKRIVTLERSLRAAMAENARLAYAHPLTGVYNRAYLMSQLPLDIRAAASRGDSLSLILCDADYLKRVNDCYGHEIGGRTLIAIAELLDSLVRSDGGWLSHHGGDEFAIMLPRVDPQSAGAIAERLRLALSRESLTLAGIQIGITASFGVSGWKRVPTNASIDALLQTADECVYGSKGAGRNCVTVREL